MKQGFVLVLIIIWNGILTHSVCAQPDWQVKPEDYEFSMTVTGKVTTDGYFSVDGDDMVAVFSGGVCRGVANLKHEPLMNAYFAFLMIYSNTPWEKLSVKIFDAGENMVVSAKDTLTFVINDIVGSLEEPYIISSNLLNDDAELLSFNIPDQVGETVIKNDSVILQRSYNSTLTNIAASFSVSPGAKIYAGGEEQVSGESVNDFTSLVPYCVISEDYSDTSVYKVSVSLKDNQPPSAVKLSNNYISDSLTVNSIVGILSADDPDLGDTHQFSLVENGSDDDAGNSYFSINGNELILAGNVQFADGQIIKILVRATDSQGGTLDQSFELTVTASNHPPVFAGTPLSYVLQDNMYIYSIQVSDDEGDSIRISIENLPDWLIYNPNSKLISGAPGNEDVGDYFFKIRAGDGSMESVQNVVVTVINVNDPPEINYFIESQYFLTGRDNSVQLPLGCITDPDEGDQLTFRLIMENNSALPGWLYFDPGTFILRGNPPQGTAESISLKLTATDPGKLNTWVVFNLIITVPTAADFRQANLNFRCFPNPVADILNIVIPEISGKSAITIFNNEGKTLKYLNLTSGGQTRIFMGDMPPGLYFIKYIQANNQKVEKIIKE
jgi:hypothetical protein